MECLYYKGVTKEGDSFELIYFLDLSKFFQSIGKSNRWDGARGPLNELSLPYCSDDTSKPVNSIEVIITDSLLDFFDAHHTLNRDSFSHVFKAVALKESGESSDFLCHICGTKLSYARGGYECCNTCKMIKNGSGKGWNSF